MGSNYDANSLSPILTTPEKLGNREIVITNFEKFLTSTTPVAQINVRKIW
jgi:hypothetical protein